MRLTYHPMVQPYAPPTAPYGNVPSAPGPTGRMPLDWEIGQVISGALNVFQRNWTPLCVGILIVGMAVGLPLIFAYVGVLFVSIGAGAVAQNGAPDEGALVALAIVGVVLALVALVVLLMPIFMARLIRIAISAVRGNTPVVNDIFKGEMRYGAMLALLLLQSTLVGLGYMCFIVPGVILAIGTHFAAFLVVDQKMGAVDALKASWQLTKGRKGAVFGIVIVLSLVNMGAGLIPFVGHFIGYSLMMLGLAIVYLRLLGEPAPWLPPEASPYRGQAAYGPQGYPAPGYAPQGYAQQGYAQPQALQAGFAWPAGARSVRQLRRRWNRWGRRRIRSTARRALGTPSVFRPIPSR